MIVKEPFRFQIVLVGALFFSPLAFGQDGIVNLRFTATEANGRVFLDWTMNFGQTCNGIDITRSTDSLNFDVIGDIQGICGSPTDTVRYAFTDEFPVPNKTNFYRLVLGNLGPSQTVKVDIVDIDDTGYQVRPNPITESGRIYFQNDRSQAHILTLFTISGKAVEETITRSDFFEINSAKLEAGLYVFRIESEKGQSRVNGKILVTK